MPITAKTKICGIIGDPVEHSISPPIHNSAFNALGLDFVYVAFPVKDVKKAADGIRALDIRGVNVTLPHKIEIMKYIDSIDPLAGKIGAVNTIHNKNGKLHGYNTDAKGALDALVNNGVEVKGKNIVVLGAGGASRAICFILSKYGSVTILNRTEEKAKKIASAIGAEWMKLSKENILKSLKDADVLVNATRVGLEKDETLVTSSMLNPGIAVFDAVYPETSLIKEARKAGCKAIDGVDMVVYQAVDCFELWTGKKAPLGIMRKKADELCGRT